MKKLKVKEIELMDLKDETLMKILKFDPYDCDKVVFKYNDDISDEELHKKIVYLSDSYHELIRVLYDENHDWKFDKSKHDNVWMRIKKNDLNEIMSVGTDLKDISLIIPILNGNMFDVRENVIEIIENKFNDAKEENNWFSKKYLNEKFILQEITYSNGEIISNETYYDDNYYYYNEDEDEYCCYADDEYYYDKEEDNELFCKGDI